jgi:hypothetical protein
MPPLDDADKQTINEMIGEALKGDDLTMAITSAVTSTVKGLKLDKLDDTIASKVAEAVKATTPEPTKGDDKGGKGKGGDAGDDKVAQQLAAMEKQLKVEREAREKSEAARQAERLHGAARAALTAADVPGSRIKGAMALLQAEGLLVVDDDGNPGIKGTDKYGVDAVLPLDVGVPAWLKTDDGKQYLPPTGAQGTGDGSATGSKTIKGKDGEVDVSKLGQALFGAIGSGSIDIG